MTPLVLAGPVRQTPPRMDAWHDTTAHGGANTMTNPSSSSTALPRKRKHRGHTDPPAGAVSTTRKPRPRTPSGEHRTAQHSEDARQLDVTSRPRARGHHLAHTARVASWGTAQPPDGVWRDARGYVRTPVTLPGANQGRPPGSKGKKYPPDPPTTVEVVRLLNGCSDTPIGHRLRALICLLWQTGMRIAEALALNETDLDPVKGSITIRHGKGDKRRVVGMDPWGWDQLRPWLAERQNYPAGPVFCVLEGPTAGRGWEGSQVRFEMHRLAKEVGLRKRIHPHAFRHAFASARARERMPWHLLQQQLGHADLRVLSRYLSGISHDEVLDAARVRPVPTLSAPELIEVLGDA